MLHRRSHSIPLIIPFSQHTDPVESVDLELLNSGRDAAARSTNPSIDFTSDANISVLDSLVLVEGGTYGFQVTTDVVNPAPSSAWERRSTENEAGTNEKPPVAAATAITCPTSAATYSDMLTLTGVTYDMYDGKYIHVTLDNMHDNDGVSSWVKLDVHGKLPLANLAVSCFAARLHPVQNQFRLQCAKKVT